MPRIWVLLLTLAGAGVVVLSWTAPEPAPQPTGYQHISYSQCAQDLTPSYGTRSVSDIQCIR